MNTGVSLHFQLTTLHSRKIGAQSGFSYFSKRALNNFCKDLTEI